MKIISWNVNGIRAVEKKDFVPWILNRDADAVCIQETKANVNQLSPAFISPGKVENSGIPEFDSEGRVTIAFLKNLQSYQHIFRTSGVREQDFRISLIFVTPY